VRALVACVLLIAACSRENRDKPPAADVARPLLTSQDTSRAHRDSVQFRLLADSMGRLEARLDSLDGNPSAAGLLFQLGELKKSGESWMYSGGPGNDYARQRPTEYWHNDPDDNYVYTGAHWKQLIERFPRDSLADEAGWALAHRTMGGECEGDVICGLGRGVALPIGFLEKFPDSDHAGSAVEEVNAALDDFQRKLPDLKDTSTVNDRPYDPADLAAIVSRYDAAAARLPAAIRADAYRITSELWTRLGKPGRRH